MKEIEVGEYVRTKEGEIHKVIKIIEDDGAWDYYCCENNAGYFAMDIAKHSKIILEVVEVGDYVNGKLIHNIDKGPNYCYLYYENCKTFVDYQIKTILTKEQMEANQYVVK